MKMFVIAAVLVLVVSVAPTWPTLLQRGVFCLFLCDYIRGQQELQEQGRQGSGSSEQPQEEKKQEEGS